MARKKPEDASNKFDNVSMRREIREECKKTGVITLSQALQLKRLQQEYDSPKTSIVEEDSDDGGQEEEE